MLLFLNFFYSGSQICVEQDLLLFALFPWSVEVVGSVLYHPPPRSDVLRGSRSQIMQVRYKKGIMKQIGGNCLLRSETSQAFDRL